MGFVTFPSTNMVLLASPGKNSQIFMGSATCPATKMVLLATTAQNSQKHLWVLRLFLQPASCIELLPINAPEGRLVHRCRAIRKCLDAPEGRLVRPCRAIRNIFDAPEGRLVHPCRATRNIFDVPEGLLVHPSCGTAEVESKYGGLLVHPCRAIHNTDADDNCRLVLPHPHVQTAAGAPSRPNVARQRWRKQPHQSLRQFIATPLHCIDWRQVDQVRQGLLRTPSE